VLPGVPHRHVGAGDQGRTTEDRGQKILKFVLTEGPGLGKLSGAA
jgi:hypothetical protein